MTKKVLYVALMATAMMTIAPQCANAQFGLLKKLAKEKNKGPYTVTQARVLQEMSQYDMRDKESLTAIVEAYKSQLGDGKEFLALNAMPWRYERDDFGNIIDRYAEIITQYRDNEDGNIHVCCMRCSQKFNGAGYDEIRIFYPQAFPEDYRDRIIVNE